MTSVGKGEPGMGLVIKDMTGPSQKLRSEGCARILHINLANFLKKNITVFPFERYSDSTLCGHWTVCKFWLFSVNSLTVHYFASLLHCELLESMGWLLFISNIHEHNTQDIRSFKETFVESVKQYLRC